MASFQHIATGIQVAALLAALEAKSHLFGQHTARATAYDSPHRAMTDIWVRFNDIANLGPHFTDEHDSIWYPAYAELPELAPIIFGLMAHVHGERLGGVLITKIPAGGRIEPHVDRCWHADYYDKFYISLRNDPGALFHFPEGDIVASPGDCYWFDNGVTHSVSNDSQADRISLIVCIKTDNFKELKRDRLED
ncbi:aspartyl/asparaginyl beta-hydroxylase domain-containing protein [Massilia antarctica]|uniref:aspartyl/asparaginyl beta-hydroxylase domain-containing protein n=1 Tax=Massilia antarctica TaxID=2765360 RepID=UPI00226FF05D|nr:aspartyl/asparaginyl beta-hydroxylase domain-containing protein [Massilia sp. H27-R4]MCY0916231.1 aspartyl/asparaginyl beta-hydroxylase domain-containing protein [Massilia sp. H27-R4]